MTADGQLFKKLEPLIFLKDSDWKDSIRLNFK